MVEESNQDRLRRNRCQTLNEAVHQGFAISVECKGCHHSRVIDPEPLWRLTRVRNWPDDFISVGNRMKCKKCDSRYPEVKPVSEPVDAWPTIGIATEAEALKMAQRMRG